MSRYGKFENEQQLYKAYLNLEKEFTKKCKVANAMIELNKSLEKEQIYNMAEQQEALEMANDKIKELEQLLKRQVGCSNCRYQQELEERVRELEHEQIAEMQEHQEAMKIADERIKKIEDLLKRQVGCSNCRYKEELEQQIKALPKSICGEIREELSIVSYIHDIEKNKELINDIGVVIQKVQKKYEENNYEQN